MITSKPPAFRAQVQPHTVAHPACRFFLRRRWLPAALAVASLGGAVGLAVAPATGAQVDFEVYRMGAAHLSALYSQQLTPYHLHFTYPPFAALVFWPLAQLPLRAADIGWAVVNLAALAALAAVSIRAVRPAWTQRRCLGLALIVLFPLLRLSPDILTLDYGQVNLLLAVAILADLTGRVPLAGGRALPRGILVGIAAAVKLTPLIFIPYLLATRQFRAAAAAACSFGLCTAAAFALAPGSSRIYWTDKVFQRANFPVFISDQNLHAALQRIAGGPPPAIAAAALTVVCAAAGLMVATWAHRSGSPLLGICLCAATGLIVSPVSWAHHYVWIVPVLAWLVLGADRPAGGRWWALAAAALFWAAPIWWVPDPQRGYGGPLVLLAGNSFFLAAVAFILLAAGKLRRRHRPEHAHAGHRAVVSPERVPAPAGALAAELADEPFPAVSPSDTQSPASPSAGDYRRIGPHDQLAGHHPARSGGEDDHLPEQRRSLANCGRDARSAVPAPRRRRADVRAGRPPRAGSGGLPGSPARRQR